MEIIGNSKNVNYILFNELKMITILILYEEFIYIYKSCQYVIKLLEYILKNILLNLYWIWSKTAKMHIKHNLYRVQSWTFKLLLTRHSYRPQKKNKYELEPTQFNI